MAAGVSLSWPLVSQAAPGGKIASAARDRVEGLLIGTFFGDALGGPIEFQDPQKIQSLPDPPKQWAEQERLDHTGIVEAAARLRLRSYRDLRMVPEPYGHWTRDAEPGTVTDDSRHKLVLIAALEDAQARRAWPISEQELAQAYLDWPRRKQIADRPEYDAICKDWLLEMQLSARWVLGERDLAKARPTERLWVGLPTCCGQMTLPPLAAIFPGQPENAYLAAYSLAFLDNGFGRDLNAALVAGLATALVSDANPQRPDEVWDRIYGSMRRTDPFGYAQVPWSQRSVDRWLDFALGSVKEADSCPAKLFAKLENEFRYNSKWEAQVPFVVTFASLAITDYDPLAAMQLSQEWGHDTDSYAQLLGAFVGAVYGPAIFPAEMRSTVERRLKLDYGQDLNQHVDLLLGLRKLATSQPLFRLKS